MEQVPFDQFYAANVGLVHKVCGKVFKRVLMMGYVVQYDDLFQEASYTMMKAYEGFDPSLGFRFSTYYVRAAFNDLNRFLREYDRDVSHLRVMSMHAATDEDGDMLDIEATIDGGHATPEQMLAAKQTQAAITARLSPLAKMIVELTVEPPEVMVEEWECLCKMEGKPDSEITAGFINTYVQKLSGTSVQDIKLARREIRELGEEML